MIITEFAINWIYFLSFNSTLYGKNKEEGGGGGGEICLQC